MPLFGFPPAPPPETKKILPVASARNRKQWMMVFPDARIEEIERQRVARGISHQQLCARAGMDLSTWFCMRRGATRPRLASINRLAQAVAVMPRRPPPLTALARAVEALIVSTFAGDPPLRELLVYARNRSQAAPALSPARVRTLTAYVLVAELGLRLVDVAAAYGVAKSTIAEARSNTEAAIEASPLVRAAFDALVRQLGNDDEGEPCNAFTGSD